MSNRGRKFEFDPGWKSKKKKENINRNLFSLAGNYSICISIRGKRRGRERIWRGAVVCRKNISVEFVQGWAMSTPLIHYAATWSWNCEDSFVPLTRGILTNRACLSEWRFERHSLAIVSFFLCSCFPTVIYICIYLHQSVENDSIFTTRRF